LFAVLDPESTASGNGNVAQAKEAVSQWKKLGRNEGLRSSQLRADG
jgi:hypothetical protein